MNREVKVGILSSGHDDWRRAIHEHTFDNQTIQVFDIKSSGPIGNHYHKVMTDTFLIWDGEGTLRTCPVNEAGELQLAELQEHRVEAFSTIQIPPYTSHVFHLQPGTQMVCIIDRTRDESDIYPCPLPD